MAFGTGVSNLLATTATVGMLVRSCSKFSQAQKWAQGANSVFTLNLLLFFFKKKVLYFLREFCGKSDAAFGGCGFFGGCAPLKRVIPGSVRGLW